MKLVTRKLKSLKPAPWNPRENLQPGEHEYEAIKASLGEFGLVQPLVLNKRSGFLVGGHQRRSVMLAEGLTEAQVVEVDLDEAAEKRLGIQLNGTGRWDNQKLATMLAEMKAQDIDLTTLGFSKTAVADLLNASKPEPKQDPDTPTGPVTVPVTKLGDLYEIWCGDSDIRHRVLCGDSTNPSDVGKLMDGHKARMFFTDPPYGMDYDATSNPKPGTKRFNTITNDNLKTGNLVQFLSKAFKCAHDSTIEKAALYCFFISFHHIEFETALIETGWRAKQELVWAKPMIISRLDYHPAHESLFYGCKTGHNCEWLGDRTETTLFDAEKPLDLDSMSKDDLREMLKAITQHSTIWSEKRDPSASYIHPTQKPTSLARRAMRNSSLPGDLVIDCFGGSGSTLIAAELEGRAARILELDPCYIDAILQRFEATFQDVHISLNGTPYQ